MAPTDGSAPAALAGGAHPSVDFFVSYAREDLHAVGALAEALRACSRSVWVDLEGLYAGEPWWPSLCRAIEAAQVLVFVLSPDSAGSLACRAELDEAARHGKRIVPLAWRTVDPAQLPPLLQQIHWLLLPAEGDPMAVAADRLSRLLEQDPAWLRGHTRWLQHALDWDRRGRPAELLLRGQALAEAQSWLAGATPAHDPAPVPVQQALITASACDERLQRARHQLEVARRPDLALSLLQAETGEPDDPRTHALRLRALQQARRVERLWSLPAAVRHLAVDRTGTRLLLGAAQNTALWDIGTRPARCLGASLGAAWGGSPHLSPDGRRLVVEREGALLLLDSSTTETLATLPVPEDCNPTWAFSPDGRWLAVGLAGEVLLCDAADGRVCRTLDHGPTAIGSAQPLFAPDGRSLATWCGARLRLWPVDGGRWRWEASAGTRSTLNSLRFSADGALLVAARGNARIALWRSDSGEALPPLVAAPGTELTEAWFGPRDGTLLASGSALQAWQWPSRKRCWPGLAHHGCFAFSPGGRYLATAELGSVGRIHLRDAGTGELLETLARQSGAVNALAWLPDDSALIAGDEQGWLSRWEMSTRSLHAQWQPGAGPVQHLAVLPDGSGVAAVGGGTGVGPGASWAIVWRFDHGLAEPGPEGRWARVQTAATAGALVLVPQAERAPALVLGRDGRQTLAWLGADHGWPRTLVASPDGRWVVAAGQDARLRLIDPRDWQVRQVWRGAGQATQLCFSADGRRLLAIGRESPCTVWDLASGACLRRLGSDTLAVEQAALSPDGRLLACAESQREVAHRVRREVDCGVRIVDVDSGATLCRIERWPSDRFAPGEMRNRFEQLAFSADGRTLLLLNSVDGAVCLADSTSGQLRVLLADDEQRLEAAVWLPDGRIAISGHGRLRVLQAADGRCELDGPGALGRHWLPAPDGRQALAVASHGLQLWQLPQMQPVVDLFDGVDRFPAIGHAAAFSPDGHAVLAVEADGRAVWFPVSPAAVQAAASAWCDASGVTTTSTSGA